ncbi:restriction endonuclease subunit S [Acetobacter persici]|uniref:restriction endonuclease subunit S n=1 Tax=Acetobacter persici TaxID=1076596 RepID=UPI001BADFCE2|nr:restriction endonuclease subunit S [Acetobacter persici]MBS0964205.1 restriction endonuclease subunit S [Acetobacter persici]
MLPEGWKNVQLGEISKVTGGKRLPKGGVLVSHDTGYPYIRVTDMLDGGVCISNIKYVPENLSKSIEKYRIFKDDLFITVAGTIGVIGSIPDELNGANLTENADRISEIKANKIFLMEFLRSPFIQSYIENVKTNNAQPKLALEQIRTFPILLPPLPEQKKIAAILSTWDRAIEGTEKLLANSQQQKKALMQQLLTGKKRLPGFSGEWEKTNIGNIAKEISIRNKNRKDYPVISCTKTKGFVDSLSFFNKKVYSDDLSGYKIISRNQIGFPSNHVEEGSIGLQNLHDNAIVSPIYTIFSMEENADPLFVFAVLKTDHYRQIFAAATNSSVDRRGSLRWSAFSQIKINLPSLPEQKAIAAVLTTADEEITALESDLSRLRQEKKALMQQLLTGKRRVKVD